LMRARGGCVPPDSGACGPHRRARELGPPRTQSHGGGTADTRAARGRGRAPLAAVGGTRQGGGGDSAGGSAAATVALAACWRSLATVAADHGAGPAGHDGVCPPPHPAVPGESAERKLIGASSRCRHRAHATAPVVKCVWRCAATRLNGRGGIRPGTETMGRVEVGSRCRRRHGGGGSRRRVRRFRGRKLW